MFKDTKKEIIKAQKYIIPVISYITISLSIGYIVDNVGLGKTSYIIITIGIPGLFGLLDYFSEGSILKSFRKEWSKAPFIFHVLIIVNSLLYVNLYNLIKTLLNELWATKTTNK